MPLAKASENAKTQFTHGIFTIYTPSGSRGTFIDPGTWITTGI
jgi:hypothetical protein